MGQRVTVTATWTGTQGPEYNDVTREVYDGSLGEEDLVSPYLEALWEPIYGAPMTVASWALFELHPETATDWPPY